jgi:hypothetical protein
VIRLDLNSRFQLELLAIRAPFVPPIEPLAARSAHRALLKPLHIFVKRNRFQY